MTAYDHLFAAVFGLGYTAYAWRSYVRIRPALLANEPGARLRDYRLTIVWLWLFCLAAIALSLFAGRPLANLGLGLDLHWRFGSAAALAIAVLGLLALQVRWIATEERARARATEQLAGVSEYLPRTASELKLFTALSVTAGICEEVLYRGYLIWYSSELAGSWIAVLLSSLVFAAAHLGYGYNPALRAGALGLIFAGLYLFSGSLWIPIALHAAIDMSAGLTGWYTRGLVSQ